MLRYIAFGKPGWWILHVAAIAAMLGLGALVRFHS
jgi:hypothetical protein